MTRLVPKPLPRYGSIQDAFEGILWAYQHSTPEQQEAFRRESMRLTYTSMAKTIWEKEYPARPYDKEPRN